MHAKRINFKNHVEIFAAKIQDHSIVLQIVTQYTSSYNYDIWRILLNENLILGIFNCRLKTISRRFLYMFANTWMMFILKYI